MRLYPLKDLSEPRDVARVWRHNNRAFGALPYLYPTQNSVTLIRYA